MEVVVDLVGDECIAVAAGADVDAFIGVVMGPIVEDAVVVRLPKAEAALKFAHL